mmetsp:Transcript_85767/g.265504  ORF Transcript_85767/g.265504 Transcript_85767/m.265504 type:complete len:213 (+) Transcript_85767:1393-2031(+)
MSRSSPVSQSREPSARSMVNFQRPRGSPAPIRATPHQDGYLVWSVESRSPLVGSQPPRAPCAPTAKRQSPGRVSEHLASKTTSTSCCAGARGTACFEGWPGSMLGVSWRLALSSHSKLPSGWTTTNLYSTSPRKTASADNLTTAVHRGYVSSVVLSSTPCSGFQAPSASSEPTSRTQPPNIVSASTMKGTSTTLAGVPASWSARSAPIALGA